MSLDGCFRRTNSRPKMRYRNSNQLYNSLQSRTSASASEESTKAVASKRKGGMKEKKKMKGGGGLPPHPVERACAQWGREQRVGFGCRRTALKRRSLNGARLTSADSLSVVAEAVAMAISLSASSKKT